MALKETPYPEVLLAQPWQLRTVSSVFRKRIQTPLEARQESIQDNSTGVRSAHSLTIQ